MSVLDRNVVDFGHEDDDKVTVCISDHIPWDSEILKAHLEVLQDKVNDYLDYIASGQIYEDFGGSGKTPNIKVIFCHKPTEEVECAYPLRRFLRRDISGIFGVPEFLRRAEYRAAPAVKFPERIALLLPAAYRQQHAHLEVGHSLFNVRGCLARQTCKPLYIVHCDPAVIPDRLVYPA